MTAPLRQLTPRDVLAYSITAPHLAGGIIVHNGHVGAVQEQTKFMGGWTLWQVIKYCDARGWVFEQIKVPVTEETNDHPQIERQRQASALHATFRCSTSDSGRSEHALSIR